MWLRFVVCLAIIVLVVLSFGIMRMFFGVYNWRLWFSVLRAKREMKSIVRRLYPEALVLSRQGATAISPKHLAFCILTNTDNERDLLRRDPETYHQLRDALLRSGYPHDAIPLVHFGIQSRETVDRDYQGDWHEAAEMP
jgi:hypothetical protein